MSKTAKTILWIIVILVVIWIGYALMHKRTSAPVSPEPIKIGFIGPLSGDAAAYGQESQKVLDYRLAEINAKSDQKFQIVYEDGKCSGSEAVSAFQKLTDIDGIKIMIAGFCSSETLGIAPLTKDQKVLAVSLGSSNPTIEGASPFTFSLSYSDQIMGETLATEMSKYSKVAILTEQNDYNIGIKDAWSNKLKEYPNVKVVANETFPKGGTDFRNVLEKIKKTNPDAILLNPNVGVTAENLLKQLAEIKDWNNYKIYTQFAYLSDDSRKAVGNFAEGMEIVDAPNLVDPTFLNLKAKIENEKGSLNTLGNYYTASSIDDLDILTGLIGELGNDAQKVRDALATRHFSGFIAKDIYFSGKSFVQIHQAGKYIVQAGKAVYQAQ
jgi:branched-chain amino acid transport system substrate-binding protein